MPHHNYLIIGGGVAASAAARGIREVDAHSSIGLESCGEQFTLRTESGREVQADGVVAGIGIEPNVALAREAGLVVANGILVDQYMRTSHPDIYAAGDVATLAERRALWQLIDDIIEQELTPRQRSALVGRIFEEKPLIVLAEERPARGPGVVQHLARLPHDRRDAGRVPGTDAVRMAAHPDVAL